MSRDSGIDVVHLVWAPLGPGMLEGFVNAYRQREAGVEHRLVVIFNGFQESSEQLARFERPLEGLDHERFVVPLPTRDLTAYRAAAERVDARVLCFLNSYSRPLVDGWLAILANSLSKPDVGMTGTGGSYESAFSSAPFFLRRRRQPDFPPFPNPHLRSNGFAIKRELMLELDWPALRSKPAAWALESGRSSISRQVWARGSDVLVVGRDAVAYPPERWRESATFRSGGQRNLLIADNRTLQYERATPRRRRQLEEMAWGASSAGAGVAGERRRPAPPLGGFG